MSTNYAQLVRNAEQSLEKSGSSLRKSMENFQSSTSCAEESLSRSQTLDRLAPYAREIAWVNEYITIDPDKIDDASAAYERVANTLIKKLHWSKEDIHILPQGSASTKTLVRSPRGEKFDIDAVCQVRLSRVDMHDPMSFFDKVGQALHGLGATRKKRCWQIDEGNRTFYLEFTPSVPLDTVPSVTMEFMSLRYTTATQYRRTALAVVDTPTKRWKTSNPAGMTQWVNDQSQLKLLAEPSFAEESLSKAMGNLTPVPDQEVDLSDTLRIAIRLFKRHRDMCVYRSTLNGDAKPISIIIVTLLTSCYQGLGQLGRRYVHAIQLLADLAELMPNMIEIRNGAYWVANPTVEGENFAERWNDPADNGTRRKNFNLWCDQLREDMNAILACKSESEIREKVRYVFGCTGSITNGGKGSSGSGLPKPVPGRPVAAQPTRGLA